jgi:hypothetical protein
MIFFFLKNKSKNPKMRRKLELDKRRAALAGVLTVLLPIAVIFVSGALANGRLWLHLHTLA